MLLLIVSCIKSEPTTPAASTDTALPPADTAETGAATETGETEPLPISVADVSVAMSDTIGAVAIVTFSAEGEGEGIVAFGEQDSAASYQVAASQQDDGTWRAVLVGVPASSSGWFQVGLGEQLDETVHTYTTGAGPDWLQVERSGEPAVEGFYGLAMMGEGRGAVIVTASGEPVWWWDSPPEAASILSRVQLSIAHDTVWFNSFDLGAGESNPNGLLIGVALDGSSQQLRSLPRTHHDFLFREDGALVAPMVDVRKVDGQTVVGDAIVAVDEDDNETEIWSSWDSLSYSGPSSEWWIMLNYLHQTSDGDYVASLKNITSIARIDVDSGTPDWIISKNDAYATLTPDDTFLHQHGLHVPAEGELLVFDNYGGGFSRVLHMRIDEEAGRAETLSSHSGDVTSVIMGDVVEIEDDLVICYSSHARIDELDASGELRSQLTFSGMTNVGYITHLTAIGSQAQRR